MAALLPADLKDVDPADAWKPWTPTASDPWNRKWASHLFRRAAFGATPTELNRALADGFPKTVERLLSGAPDADSFQELFAATAGYITEIEPVKMRKWWLYVMLNSKHPLREKMALFWHNHFATSLAKIPIDKTWLMYEQNQTIRKHALGKFRPFLLEMSKDPAMLIWLDSNQNKKGAANENFAREVMELFSLGVGNYTEKDIQEAARAFTGWHHDQDLSRFLFNADLHDDGQKTFFGQKGAWSGTDIVRICCDQPSCARFLVGKLYTYLVSETAPPKGLLTPLEERFRKSDYAVSDLVGAILGSRLFFSTHAYRKRVKWPVEFALESYHAMTPGRVQPIDFVKPLSKMGQALFQPPNVKGWRTGTDWLNSATLLARNNFAEIVALGNWSNPGGRMKGPNFATATAEEPESDEGEPTQEPKSPATGKAPGKSSPPPPPPRADVDPIAIVYAEKPKDVPALVARMSELLYGDRISAAQTAKIEKFLLEPLTPPQSSDPAPKSGGGKGGLKPPPAAEVKEEAASTTSKDEPKEPKEPKKEPPKVSGPPNLDSPAFKARVREALHAMMCLPEYQLN